MNPFEVLEISPGASSEEVRAAYHRLAKQWHPDRFPGAEKTEAENRFRMLAEAFNGLKDQERRAEIEKRLPETGGKAQTKPQSPDAASRPLVERTADDWFQEAKEAFEAKDYSRALGLVHYSLRLDGNKADAYVLLGHLLEVTGGDQRALIKAIEHAIRLNPKDVDSMLHLADVFQALGMQARAARARESARQIAPNHKAFRQTLPKAPPPTSARGGLMDQFSALIGRLFKRG
jgi:curved DNA-binding protein CbpA